MFNVPSFFGFRSGGGIATPLLDTYTGAAAAYSLRGLSTPYVLGANPYAFQVRNSSNVALDIGFVFNSLTGDYELDTPTLLAHCAGGNGFVDVWYDQSGNVRNATQTIALNQPQIVSAGSVITENGKPSLQFDAVNDKLEIGTIISDLVNNPVSVFTTMKSNFNTPQGIAYNISNGTQLVSLSFNRATGQVCAIRTGVVGNKGGAYINKQSIYTLLTTNTTSNLFNDSIEITRTSIGRSTAINSIGGNLYLSMKFQEHIIYELDQSSNRTGIETNINDFYSIY
jgi:hypothetical protein